ncbi:MAG TPA: potassium channel family protein [Gemmatimonadaceae bacterium]|nr:potassium channel family protein [Gemmatimonadaceae bacterium]HUL50806.1 potassium channel family protein [Gemmatimonadales bacterium]
MPILEPRGGLETDDSAGVTLVKRRARAVESYIAASLAIESLLIVLVVLRLVHGSWWWVVIGFATLKIIEIVQVTVNATIFDRFAASAGNKVASVPRMVVLAFINFVELAACFGLLFTVNLEKLNGAKGPADAFYYSVITQLTIGYGDVHPIGYMRAIAAIHGFIAIGFVALVFARLMSALPKIHSMFDER